MGARSKRHASKEPSPLLRVVRVRFRARVGVRVRVRVRAQPAPACGGDAVLCVSVCMLCRASTGPLRPKRPSTPRVTCFTRGDDNRLFSISSECAV